MMEQLYIIMCVGLVAMATAALAIAWIANSYFNAVSRNPTIAESVSTYLLALAAMVELAILIITAMNFILIFKI